MGMIKSSPFFLRLSLGIPPSLQMYMVVWIIRDGGLGAYGTLVHPTMHFKIFVSMFVVILRSMALPIPMTTAFFLGIIWPPTTARRSTQRSPHVRVLVISISSRGRRIIPSLVPLNIKSVISPSRSSSRQSRTGTSLSWSSRSSSQARPRIVVTLKLQTSILQSKCLLT